MSVTLSTSAALSIGTFLQQEILILMTVVDQYFFVTNAEEHDVSIRYFPNQRMLMVVIPGLEFCVAAHADDVITVVNLVKRAIFKPQKKGYV
jgi:hypothetical protein